jgi:hypothetical protein
MLRNLNTEKQQILFQGIKQERQKDRQYGEICPQITSAVLKEQVF